MKLSREIQFIILILCAKFQLINRSIAQRDYLIFSAFSFINYVARKIKIELVARFGNTNTLALDGTFWYFPFLSYRGYRNPDIRTGTQRERINFAWKWFFSTFQAFLSTIRKKKYIGVNSLQPARATNYGWVIYLYIMWNDICN